MEILMYIFKCALCPSQHGEKELGSIKHSDNLLIYSTFSLPFVSAIKYFVVVTARFTIPKFRCNNQNISVIINKVLSCPNQAPLSVKLQQT